MPVAIVPVTNPLAQYKALRDEIDAAVREVLASGQYILGPTLERFEREFASYLGVRHCVGVASGTDAIMLALRAGGIGPGDRVVTVSHTAVATVAAIEAIGAEPVLCDIDSERRCMDPARLESLLDQRVKAVLPVHMYGQPADLKAIATVASNRGVLVIEDCAQAHGAAISGRRVGSIGSMGAFSFYPTKNLGAMGDGGAVTTQSDEFADRLRLLRQYGWREKYISDVAGYNSRLDDLQAALLSVKLRHLDRENAQRMQIADRYYAELPRDRVTLPSRIADTLHAMHLFVVECDERDSLRDHLKAHGIGTALHYPLAVHEQPAYTGRLVGCDRLPGTERQYRRHLSLPMHPYLQESEVSRVVAAVKSWATKS